MKKINLQIYKTYQPYFEYFDILIKNINSNKEHFLESIYLSPSSYRRAKKEGTKIAKQLTNDLCNYFNINLFTNELIDELEVKVNELYFDIYYKKNDNYDDNYNWVISMIDKNYIFNPILKLLRLLLELNAIEGNNLVEKNKELYEEVKSYEEFYNKDLLDLIEIVDAHYVEELDTYYLSKNFKNDLTYHSLAYKCLKNKRFIESIYLSNIAKERFIKNENYRRVYFINHIILVCYTELQKYEEAYELAYKQMMSTKNDVSYKYEYTATEKHYINACIGLEKYDIVINTIKPKEEINTTEMIALLYALYHTSQNDYEEYLKEQIELVTSERYKKYYEFVDKLIKTKDKTALEGLSNYRINKTLLKIIK